MLPKGNFKTDFLKYDTEEEDKLSDINIAGLLTVWRNKIKTYTRNILKIKPVICYPATNVGKHDLFQQLCDHFYVSCILWLKNKEIIFVCEWTLPPSGLIECHLTF